MREGQSVSSSVTTDHEQIKQGTRKRGISPTIFFMSIAVVLAIGYAAGVYRLQIFASIAPLFNVPASAEVLDADALQQAYRQLRANFDGELDDGALIDGAMRGMVEAAGDDYTVFLNAEEAKKMNNSLEGSIGGGIGAQVGVRDEAITLVKIIDNTPAQSAGLLAGDKVLTINGEPTKGFTTEQAVERIRGEVGTTVRLGLKRESQGMEISVTRAEISTPSVTSEVVDGLGIMTITRFDQETGRLARTAAESFVSAGVRGVIVDLRGNPGGYLSAARDVSGIWLRNKVVVVEKTGDRVVEELRSRKDAILEGVPTAVLVDGNSASASEIVAGALSDHKAATLVGETTYGKGTVQRLITLDNGAVLKVTAARWFTPNGLNLSKVGITPDKVIELSPEDVRNGNDLQMGVAKEIFK